MTGNSSNFGLSNIEPHHADHEEAGAIIQDYQEKYQCDFNTDHPDLRLNVESTEVLEEEGLDWLRDFPKFQPADLEFSDWEANAWDNEFAPHFCVILVRVGSYSAPRIMKHENGSRPNRKVAGQSSFWRASNGEKMMVQVHNRQFLGHKGALNYFKNKQSKTNWIMQEYTLASQNHHGPHKIIHQEVPFIATDDNDCGNSSNFGLSNIEPHHADPEEAGAIIQDYQEKYQCDFNTDHPDVVARLMLSRREVLEEEGLDRLRDFPNFNRGFGIQ
ncbi:LOW QUALITY PROTEIN: hypothetical protein Syun_015039 [Stephania yunnanensis]|uniref:NAC domain-containing protein n=1 Tax=Stephania yunnanensis TaxID=152371 RepID=A0AAP0JKY6_9MAGN